MGSTLINYEVVLKGFDGEDDDTDHLIKWVRSVNIDSVWDLATQLKWDIEYIDILSNQWAMTKKDGIDYIL